MAIDIDKEEPVGKWVLDDDEFDEYYGPWYKCPKCDRSVAGCDADKFCPHCGARLEE